MRLTALRVVALFASAALLAACGFPYAGTGSFPAPQACTDLSPVVFVETLPRDQVDGLARVARLQVGQVLALAIQHGSGEVGQRCSDGATTSWEVRPEVLDLAVAPDGWSARATAAAPGDSFLRVTTRWGDGTRSSFDGARLSSSPDPGVFVIDTFRVVP
jgi:hypothetical protein